jgi:outer membrane protein TolC
MAHTHSLRSARLVAASATLLLLAACTTFSPDGGFGSVESAVRERTGATPRWERGDDAAAQTARAIAPLLAEPLTADAAVQIALVNNRGLQATYAELGIAEADLVQAGRIRNPGFSYGRLTRGDEIEIERAFLFDVLGLVTMPLRTQIEGRRFDVMKTRVAAETLRVAADTRRAYYRALAAEEGVKYMRQVRDAAEASAELARRMAAAGNFSKLDQAREQVFYAETTAQLARVQQAALAEREQLTRLMGLWGNDTGYRLPERLPDLPNTARDLSGIEPAAMKQRLDVQAAMQDAQSIASSLGLTRATGFISVLELSYQHNNESGQPRQTGYEIELRLPIFDWGGARVARAEHTYMQAVNRAADTAVRARSEVREAYGAYRTAFDLARHYREEIVPLRRRISEENVLRYNGMLISVFELLADARQQVASVSAYIEALRDFWVADATLKTAMTGTSPGAIGMARTAGAQTPAAESAGGH